jgi:hypothetical protein
LTKGTIFLKKIFLEKKSFFLPGYHQSSFFPLQNFFIFWREKKSLSGRKIILNLMGSSKSKNYVSQVTNDMFSAMNTASQSCPSTISQSQTVSTGVLNNSIYEVGSLTGNQVAGISLQCLATQVQQTKLTQALNQVAQQYADSVKTTFGIGVAQAQNISNNVINLATVISNQANQSCISQAAQNQLFNIGGANGSLIRVGTINWNQQFTGIVSCIQNSTQYTQATQQLQQSVDQVAKSSNTLGFGIGIAVVIIVIIIIIALVVIFFLYNSRKTVTDPNLGKNIEAGTKAGAMIAAPEVALPAAALSSSTAAKK